MNRRRLFNLVVNGGPPNPIPGKETWDLAWADYEEYVLACLFGLLTGSLAGSLLTFFLFRFITICEVK